ncbi:MAG: antibiotic biosynthesis monooxygenase [Chloroflexota bacterium]|nr:antibiotic biosynthesis monooxygenase [Chloroflexota bacterium]
MFIVNVFVKVKPGHLDAFLTVTKENAKNSLLEPGIARFDVLQNTDDPCQIMLNEVYRTQEDTAKHKETPHYQAWKETVADMMAAPRTKKIYQNIFPDEKEWD